MSGRMSAPLLPADQAARLLDGVLFTRVAELIDLPALCELEAMLALQIEGLGAEPEQGRALAKGMVDRALLRIARTSRRWICEQCTRSADPEITFPDPNPRVR